MYYIVKLNYIHNYFCFGQYTKTRSIYHHTHVVISTTHHTLLPPLHVLPYSSPHLHPHSPTYLLTHLLAHLLTCLAANISYSSRLIYHSNWLFARSALLAFIRPILIELVAMMDSDQYC